MVNRVVDEVNGRITIDIHLNGGGDSSLAHHLELKLWKEAGLLASHGECNGLTFTGTQASIAHQFRLPADGPNSREEDKGCPCRGNVGAGEVARITVTPQLGRHPLLVAQALPISALQISEHMLNTLLVRPSRIRIEAIETADRGGDVRSRTHCKVHEGANCALVRDE